MTPLPTPSLAESGPVLAQRSAADARIPGELATTRLEIDGVSVVVEGGPGPVVLMLHGWPDTAALWDSTVARLRTHCRCVRLTLPGFDPDRAPRAASLDQVMALLVRVLDQVSPDQPATLLLHDWGCVFGYELAARHPERIDRVVGIDIGDHNARALQQELSLRAKALVLGYQWWLALAWLVGRHVHPGLANRMTRAMAAALRCPAPSDRIVWGMNHPYAMRWFGVTGGLRTRKVRPAHPWLFVYGQRKPFMFHTREWAARLADRPGCQVQGYQAGHWVMLDQATAFHELLRDWLAGGPR